MVTCMDLYKDIESRTGGEIFIGVVGPVRSGKSTFIKKFMDTIVIPNIEDKDIAERTIDELPQSASGRTIMTTEPKFIPEQAVTVNIEGSAMFKVRMIDCVGYIMPSAIGYIEENEPRMVRTPWFDEPIPFNMAAELGTKKVITEHSTIGILITSDGSITDIDRDEYEEAEERVIKEINGTGKPYIMLLNCVYPDSDQAKGLAKELMEKYGVPVLPINCIDITEEEIKRIIGQLLYMFPVNEVVYKVPTWVLSLEKDHWLKCSVLSAIRDNARITKVCEINDMAKQVCGCEHIEDVNVSEINLGTGNAMAEIRINQQLFYKVLGEKTGIDLSDDSSLYNHLVEMTEIKSKYTKLQEAWDSVNTTGYGIVMPEIDELTLEEPVIIRQNGKYGVKLRAMAPSIHMMKTTICTELTPIVGSEQQSEELVTHMMSEFEEDPIKIWDSNIFGKSLHELVNEGLHNKLSKMPEDARDKVRETIERVINDGCSGLVCIIL